MSLALRTRFKPSITYFPGMGYIVNMDISYESSYEPFRCPQLETCSHCLVSRPILVRIYGDLILIFRRCCSDPIAMLQRYYSDLIAMCTYDECIVNACSLYGNCMLEASRMDQGSIEDVSGKHSRKHQEHATEVWETYHPGSV
jgi:hypothetical protein